MTPIKGISGKILLSVRYRATASRYGFKKQWILSVDKKISFQNRRKK